jgi:hypothetical protein
LGWLLDAVKGERHMECSPIGFYFAKLWYYERLYPLVFAASALGIAHRHWCTPHDQAITTHPTTALDHSANG